VWKYTAGRPGGSGRPARRPRADGRAGPGV